MKIKKYKNRILSGIMLGVLILVSVVPAMAEDITLQTPNTTQAGSILPIRWSYNGSFEPNVTVELLKDGSLIGTIASDTYIGDVLNYQGTPYGEGHYWFWNVSESLLAGNYQIKITGNTTTGLETNDIRDIDVTTATSNGCRTCHPAPDISTRHHHLVDSGGYGCFDCHPIINNSMYIEYNCLNCHNGTAWYLNPLVINPGQPHLNTVPPPDNTPPVINSITLSDNTPYTADNILITVNATDDALITSVTANDVSLTKQSGNIWTGNITAIEGTHSIDVSAKDVAGHETWDNSTSYTATTPPPDTPPVINSVTLSDNTPNTGDNILVTVNATDDALITSVTANDVSLTKQSDNIWTGNITAIEGTHPVNVSASDGTGHITWDNSTSYTAITDTPPVINSVTLSDNTPNTGDNILVTVNATDDVLVTNVVANGISLTKQSNDIWNGSITVIEGIHSVYVSANDGAGHVTWDNSTSYTAITPNIIITSPKTGDNWVRDTTQTIRWTYNGNLGNSATVVLLKSGIADKTWNNVPQASGVGSLNWSIPSKYDTGTTYQIRVSAGGYSNTTGNFNIVKR